MLEESTFSESEIIDSVAKNYNIKIDKIEKINAGTANLYKLINKENKYVLKEFQSKYTETSVIREIETINHLKKKLSVPVPEILQCNNMHYYFKNKGKTVVLQNFIDGFTCNKNEGNYEQLMESAQYLGKIVKGLEDFKTNGKVNIQDWYSNKELKRAEEKYNFILENVKNNKIENKIKEDIIYKKDILKHLQEIIDFSEIDKVTHKVSHGDYNCLQFIYDENKKIKAILDFIKVKKLPLVWEIARSYSYIDKEASNGKINIKNIVNYTREVSKIVELNAFDLKYLPYVYLIQLVRSTFGYEQYYQNVKNKEELLNFAFYRTNICRDLYKKSKEISEQLLELKWRK